MSLKASNILRKCQTWRSLRYNRHMLENESCSCQNNYEFNDFIHFYSLKISFHLFQFRVCISLETVQFVLNYWVLFFCGVLIHVPLHNHESSWTSSYLKVNEQKFLSPFSSSLVYLLLSLSFCAAHIDEILPE